MDAVKHGNATVSFLMLDVCGGVDDCAPTVVSKFVICMVNNYLVDCRAS